MTGTDQLEGRICQQLQAGPPVDYDGEVADAWMAARLVVLLTEEVPALVLTAIRASAGEGEAPADHEARVAVVATKLKEKAAIRADLIRRDSNQPWDFDLEARGILQALSLGEAPAEPWGEGPLGVTGDIPEHRPGEAPAGLTRLHMEALVSNTAAFKSWAEYKVTLHEALDVLRSALLGGEG